jgi:SAM-dependent methyltransferase
MLAARICLNQHARRYDEEHGRTPTRLFVVAGLFPNLPCARHFLADPARILAPYAREGMTVLEPGPSMGFFILELARKVGFSGRVIAVDIQPKMIETLKRRAAMASLLKRIDARLAEPQSLGLNRLTGTVDFVLAFAVAHEMPDAGVLCNVHRLAGATPRWRCSISRFTPVSACAMRDHADGGALWLPARKCPGRA